MYRFAVSARRFAPIALIASIAFVQKASAEDAYFEVPVGRLKILEQAADRQDWAQVPRNQWRLMRVMPAYATLDGEGEIFLGADVGSRFQGADSQTIPAEEAAPGKTKPGPQKNANRTAVAIRIAQPRTVTGTICVPRRNFSGMMRIRFSVDLKKTAATAKPNFYLTKSEHYTMLQNLDVPGGAWFRYEAALAKSIATGKRLLEPYEAARRNEPQWQSNTDLENRFDVFSGGRAISENLQLDRLLPGTKPQAAHIDLNTLPGISVAEMDWKKLNEGIQPKLDPLAKYIPHDQHVLFFPSFAAMTTLIDEADSVGTPLLHVMQSRAENARSKERYQRQLCLEVSAVSRLLGPQFIRSVAFTGSDPYLPTGTDVALLFEAKSSTLLKQYLISKHVAAEKSHAGCKRVKGKVAGLAYVGAVSPDRRICSYVAAVDDVVIVTNSLVQIRQLAETRAGKTKNLAALPEYRFFRQRYQIDAKDDAALLIVTDATIRRWCGPKWRIANSRRTRAAAVMSHHQAEHLATIVSGKVVSGKVELRPIETELYVHDLGILQLTKAGITSTEYGSLEFMTPIAELDFDKVSQDEADNYRRWRDGYQQNWRQYFDPIAVRIAVKKNRLSADVTVMPLIDQSEYRSFIELTSGATIKPAAGDPHAGTLLHWTTAINAKSAWGNLGAGFIPLNPLSWLGDSISVYADADPFWLDFAKIKDSDRLGYMGDNLSRIPIAVQAEVKDGLKLVLYMTALHGYIDKTAPGMLTWDTLKHNGRAYVRVRTTRRGGAAVSGDNQMALYYLVSSKSLTLTFNEPLLKRAIDREIAREKAALAKKPVKLNTKPWLGKSMALQLDRAAIGYFEAAFGDDYREIMQARAWANLPVLNEWKRRYPKRNPVEMHQQVWNVELRCPGNGRYVWNEKQKTMESTIYGHPNLPKPGPKQPATLRDIQSANFGVTFENKGLRARMEIERVKK